MFLKLVSNLLTRWTLALLLVTWGCGSNPASESQDDPADDTEESASKPAEGAFAEVNGTRLFYDVKGTGEPLVLISGGSLDMRLWDEQFAVFAEDRQVIRYDPRGVGKSDLPNGPFSHEQDLYALLQFLGIQEADVLGFSFGGGVAIDFVPTYPEVPEVLMSEYIRFAKLPILLLVLFMIARLILGATGVPYQSGTIVSMVSLAWVSAFFFGAFSRRLRGYSLKQAALLGLTIALSGQVLIFAATLVSYLVGAETYFNHPTALNQTEAVAMGPAVLARVGGLVANSIIGSIWGLLGWTGGKLLPKAA